MNTIDTNNTSEILSDAQLIALFDMKESGASFTHALSSLELDRLSPSEIAGVEGLWETHELLSSAASVIPTEALAEGVVSALPAAHVTPSPFVGYTEQQGTFIRSNFFAQYMKINWKFVAPVGVVMLLLVAVMHKNAPVAAPLAMHEEDAPALVVAEPVPVVVASKSVPEVSGDVDDLVASLGAEADADAAAFSDTGTDLALASADGQEINDLTTSYDETTF